MLNLAWDLALGKPVWGIVNSKTGKYVFVPERPMKVLYFTQEDTEDDLHDRVETLIKGGRQWTDNLWYVSKNLNLRFEGAEGVNAIKSAIDIGAPFDLIIFDTFRRMHSKSENDSDIIAAIYRIVDNIQQTYNCAIAFVHHIVKPSNDPNSLFDPASPHAGRGSGDIFGGADSFINCVPQANRNGNSSRQVTLHFENKRSRPLPPTRLKMDFDTGIISFEGFGDPRRAASSGETPHL